jgi:hypothetical protein
MFFTAFPQLQCYTSGSVPMARGKHLFPCRTQKLSLAAVTILGVHPWENSTVPNYIKAIRIGWLLSFTLSHPESENVQFEALYTEKWSNLLAF